MPIDASSTPRAASMLLIAWVAVSACSSPSQPPVAYDLVVANGRVMDPDSQLDAVRHVGIRGGRIEAVSEAALAGTRVIDASQHVVAPGFIDLHEHGQQEESYAMMVRGARRRAARQPWRVGRTHPGAHESAGRSRDRSVAGRRRRQRPRR
jgi:hypothetical protein